MMTYRTDGVSEAISTSLWFFLAVVVLCLVFVFFLNRGE